MLINKYLMRLTLPEELVKLMEEEEAGAVGRRRVYGRLFAMWRAATGGKAELCGLWSYQLEKKEEGEGAAGKYDSQHECNQSATHLTIADLAKVDWRQRPAQPGSGKRKAGSSSSGCAAKALKI
ncbi:hypothetical protein ElyMa_004258300 [Elysia marginata]|uniref:Uncharacterized protein n=1 Tax=Elysia marginata TaxID=1093978 RepID=A0AAV4GUA5_9GAST|nr:hypothetical protein ElyMa_004258300 [Elysia marginata]